MRAPSAAPSNAHSSTSNTASIRDASNSLAMCAGAGVSGASMRRQNSANWLAVTFDIPRAMA